MFHATVRPRQLTGSSAIEDLQQALKNLAQATANSAWDPGSVSGFVTDQTIGALSRAIPHLVHAGPGLQHVAGELISAIHTADRHSGARPRAIDLIGRYAPQLTQGARVLAYRYMAGRYPVPPANNPSPSSLHGITDLVSTSRASSVMQRIAASASSSPSVKTYPAGTIKTKSKSGNYWRIAIPRAAAKAALGGVNPGMGGDMVEVAKVLATTDPVIKETGEPVPEVSQDDFNKQTTPWYKKWQTWAVVGGVVVVGGAVIVLRR